VVWGRVAGWMIGGSSTGRGWEFFSSAPNPDRFWGSPSLVSNGLSGSLSLGVKRPGREADRSPPSSAEAKNPWRYISTPSTPSGRGAQLKHRIYTFTFTLLFHVCEVVKRLLSNLTYFSRVINV
jgi:hypothetical protein